MEIATHTSTFYLCLSVCREICIGFCASENILLFCICSPNYVLRKEKHLNFYENNFSSISQRIYRTPASLAIVKVTSESHPNRFFTFYFTLFPAPTIAFTYMSIAMLPAYIYKEDHKNQYMFFI